MILSDVAIAIVTRMGQDKPGALQGWLGSKNRARADSIASKDILKKTWICCKTSKQGHYGDIIKASTGTNRGHYGDS